MQFYTTHLGTRTSRGTRRTRYDRIKCYMTKAHTKEGPCRACEPEYPHASTPPAHYALRRPKSITQKEMGAYARPARLTTGEIRRPGRWRRAPRHQRPLTRTIFADTRARRAKAEPLRLSEARPRRTKSPGPGERIPPFDNWKILRRAVHQPEDTSHTRVTGGAGPMR